MARTVRCSLIGRWTFVRRHDIVSCGVIRISFKCFKNRPQIKRCTGFRSDESLPTFHIAVWMPLRGYNAFIYPAIAQHARVKMLDYVAMNYFNIIFDVALREIFAVHQPLTQSRLAFILLGAV